MSCPVAKTVEDSAKIFMNVLNNTATAAQKQAVLANAAYGTLLR
jgi:anthranilate phosphoribosyltransferase